jgi:hypothetical protein
VYELATRFGCHRNTVSRLLKSRGVELRHAPLTDDQVDQAENLYLSGLSLAQVAAQLKLNSNTIRLRLLQRCVRMRDSHGRERGM